MKKLFAIFLAVFLISNTIAPAMLYAQEAPSAPTAPTAPSTPDVPNEPTAPSVPNSPSSPGSSPTPQTTQPPKEHHNSGDETNNSENPTPTPTTGNGSSSSTPTPTAVPTAAGTTGSSGATGSTGSSGATGQTGQVGDTRVATGDANSSATMVTTGNSNGSVNPATGNGDSAQVNSSGNGANSTNNATVSNNNDSATIQDNVASVNNNLEQHASSGGNDASGNLGETLVKTGDANVSGTIITAVNTNVDGVAVSEFDIADDHKGDIVLDFGKNCISGCGTGSTDVTTQGNGANSDNTTTVNNNTNDTTFQNNDAAIGNTLTLSADSGNNKASENTGGDTTIVTGDANVSANALTFANNNIAGNVVYGVVNIYGDLVGDIIFPEEAITNCCATQGTSVATTNNGAGSTNTTNVNNTDTNTTAQTNTADIGNTLNLDGQTGSNDVSGNTGGDNRSYTGDANVDANVINIANSNVDGGNMWLVIVNEAGKWIGKIMGAPEGSNMAASQGTTLSTDANGQVVATNGNGANSTNTTNVNNTTNTTTTQNNNADVKNTLNLSANTGNNEASHNTGGDSNVVTGDANIVANMVNFVNNNITGGGKLFVTVVNVFGSWVGDLVTPGQKQEDKTIAESTTSQGSSGSHVGGANVVLSTPTQTPIVSTTSAQGETELVQTTDTTEDGVSIHAPIRTARRSSLLGTVLGTSSTENISITDTPSFTDSGDVEHADAPEATITPVIAGQRVMKINLAWLIFVIPGGILLLALRGLTRRIIKRLP